MKKYGIFVLAFVLAMLPAGEAVAQEHTVHRNIGLDSVMVLMQRCSKEKIYYQCDASQANLTFTVDASSATMFDDIKGDLEANGYKVLPMKGYLFVLKGVGLAQQLPADYFTSRKKQSDVQVEKDYIDALQGRMDVATSMNKTYQIGDKGNESRTGKAYLSGYVRDAVTGEPVVGVSLVDRLPRHMPCPMCTVSIKFSFLLERACWMWPVSRWRIPRCIFRCTMTEPWMLWLRRRYLR